MAFSSFDNILNGYLTASKGLFYNLTKQLQGSFKNIFCLSKNYPNWHPNKLIQIDILCQGVNIDKRRRNAKGVANGKKKKYEVNNRRNFRPVWHLSFTRCLLFVVVVVVVVVVVESEFCSTVGTRNKRKIRRKGVRFPSFLF